MVVLAQMITLTPAESEALARCIRESFDEQSRTGRQVYATNDKEAVSVLNNAGLYRLVLANASEAVSFYMAFKRRVCSEADQDPLPKDNR